MRDADIQEMFTPVLGDIMQRSTVVDKFVDRNLYKIYLATLWANVVLNPQDIGIDESDLETVHDVINGAAGKVLGHEEDLTGCFRFINSKAGESAMREARLTQHHKELLLYFSSMILDPEGHERWMQGVRDRQN
ncbi:MAG: hypothetical protein QF921_11080 [Pseudomonadales bacterium]|jgi:hypothetical protein|nr:hypothetical protein [Pseudomonadales bacterium]MDP6470598.1 hypothetical protein [Pseudomonadales bacterium]MDP6828547.1 hypothetical protein [Pseudomonadales bacterium]MDP6972033.1 hypothetical protein [Pseudomonadales bacterium]|tara:strand:+ start:478 stop:879 length:402 start_codon:yes stop_codon:yes gene_type:complete